MLSQSNLEILCTSILMGWIVLMVSLERKFPYRKGLPFFREGFWIDFTWYTLIQSFFLKILIFDYIIQPIDVKYQLSRLQLISDWPLWQQVLLFLFTHDFYIYWFHRAQHRFPILWRTHEAHHSVKHVDWLAGSRSHIVEIIINQSIEFAPIILLGAHPAIVPIKGLIDACWGMYIHSNINVKGGWTQYIINGPEMHLWHHADEKQVYHANFSTKFAFWDWIFGSAYLPDRKPFKWGLWYDYPRDWFLQHIFSVKRFNVKKVENTPWMKKYLNLRINLMKLMGFNPEFRRINHTSELIPVEKEQELTDSIHSI